MAKILIAEKFSTISAKLTELKKIGNIEKGINSRRSGG